MQQSVWRLQKYPTGIPTDKDIVLHQEPIPDLKEHEIKIKTLYISMDPANRLWIRREGSYIPPFPLGSIMPAITIGEVVESRHPRYQVGQKVQGIFGWQEYIIQHAGPLNEQLPLDKGGIVMIPEPEQGCDLIDNFGLFGVHGMTAYFGITDVGKAQAGDTVLVSAAAGAIGSLVVQIAKNMGCRVIGIAGGPKKCSRVVKEFGADACIDYKHEDIHFRLQELAPQGVNVYFDNVGGEILEAAIDNMARYGRIAFCGAISQYNGTTPASPKNYMQILYRELEVNGFLAFRYAEKMPEAVKVMKQWQSEGRLHMNIECHEGIENLLNVFTKLFISENQGKLVVKI